jgi:hypothetical protein
MSVILNFFKTLQTIDTSDHSKNHLHIELVDPKDWEKTADKAKRWCWKAYAKADQVTPKSQIQAQLKDCGFICNTMESHILSADPANRGSAENIQHGRVGPTELYVCKDSAGKVHGIGMAEKNRTSLIGKLLVTHPRNIPTAKKDPRSVKGVGTAFLNYAQQIGPERGVESIVLMNSDSSDGFYVKKGFSRINMGGYSASG